MVNIPILAQISGDNSQSWDNFSTQKNNPKIQSKKLISVKNSEKFYKIKIPIFNSKFLLFFLYFKFLLLAYVAENMCLAP